MTRRPDSARPEPVIEIWDSLSRSERRASRLLIAWTILCFFALATATFAILIALHRPVVYYVDTDGRAVFGGRLDTASVPVAAEVRYVAQQFCRHMLAFHSLTIEADLAEAFNLMTAELQDSQRAELAEYEQSRGTSFVAFVQRQQIQTTLEVTSIDVDNHDDGSWSVRITGRTETWPLSRVGEPAPVRTRAFEAQLTLVRTERTEQTPNGLLVSHSAIRLVAAPDAAADQEALVRPAPEANR